MSITSANASITVTVPTLFPAPTQLQGFAADDIFDSNDVQMGETTMGVDGFLSGSFVYAKVVWSITFQADSTGVLTMEAWDAAQQLVAEMLPGQFNVTLTGVNRSYQLVNAYLVLGKRIPDAKKMLMPRKFTFDCQRVIPIPVGSAG